MIKITLVKGLSGRTPNQRKNIKALGLGKRGSFVIREESDSIKGMIAKVSHLVKTEEVQNG